MSEACRSREGGLGRREGQLQRWGPGYWCCRPRAALEKLCEGLQKAGCPWHKTPVEVEDSQKALQLLDGGGPGVGVDSLNSGDQGSSPASTIF